MQIHLTFIWRVVRLASLWKKGTRQLANGLLNCLYEPRYHANQRVSQTFPLKSDLTTRGRIPRGSIAKIIYLVIPLPCAKFDAFNLILFTINPTILSLILGTVHSLWGRGGGWWDLRRGHAKKYGFKGGAAQKIRCVNGGSPKNCL